MCARDISGSGVGSISSTKLKLAAVVSLAIGLLSLVDGYYPLISTGPVSVAWAAAIPWIVSGVSALAGLYSQHKASKAQNKAIDQQGEVTALQRDAANRLMPWGENLMRQGGTSLTSLLPYYTRAAYGDRSVLGELMQPELRQISESYDRPLQQLNEVSPRSGTTAAGNASILSGRAAALNDAYYRARAEGRTGLQSISGQLAGLGAGAVGAGFGGLQGASAGSLGQLSSLYNLRSQNAADSQAIGASLVDFLRAYQTWQAGRNQGGSQPGSAPNYSGAPY